MEDKKSVIFWAAKCFGYDSVKDLQYEVIEEILGGRDVFTVLPTGFGKSFCYGCLPWIFDKVCKPAQPTIVCVISPLVAIIKEQVLLQMET